MLRWKNSIAVVTGASSGIGAAIVKDLVKNNVIVVGLARRVERVEQIRASLPAEQQKLLHPIKCDVSNQVEVEKSFEWIIKTLGGVDILINNAGVFKYGFMAEMDTKEVLDTMNINVMGIVYCTKAAFKNMKERDVNGHVILINSVAGHNAINAGDISLNIYSPSKFAVTAMTEIYRQEFQKLGTKVKITSISPGLVDTEIITVDFDKSLALKAENISDAVMYVLGTPPNVQVHELTIKPMGEKM